MRRGNSYGARDRDRDGGGDGDGDAANQVIHKYLIIINKLINKDRYHTVLHFAYVHTVTANTVANIISYVSYHTKPATCTVFVYTIQPYSMH